MEALERITKRVCRNGHPDDLETPIPLLSIDEFFDGNDVVGSIGCNLIDIPHPNEFFKVFKAISHRPDERILESKCLLLMIQIGHFRIQCTL